VITATLPESDITDCTKEDIITYRLIC